ncbi:MAG: hypothetical protein AAGC55_17050, partial [Myxococcota bacterium]
MPATAVAADLRLSARRPLGLVRLIGVLAALLVAPAAVAAQPSESMDDIGVALSVDECIVADAEQIRRLLFIELGAPGRPTSLRQGERTDAVTRVELSCADQLIELRVHDPVTGKSLTRRIAPGKRRGRERLLALAAVELVVASWIELTATPAPVAIPAGPPADAMVRESAEPLVGRRLPVELRWSS